MSIICIVIIINLQLLLQARAELEREAKQIPSDSLLAIQRTRLDERELEHSPVLAVQGVYYTCALLGEEIVLSKQEVCYFVL
jgi:hypothetical protein